MGKHLFTFRLLVPRNKYMRSSNTIINWLKIRYYRINLANPLANRYKLQTATDLSPFFIIGSGRSGNTLLRRILNNHSKLFIPPETYVLGSVIQLWIIYGGAPWKHIVSLVFDSFELYPEFDTFDIKSLIELKKDMIKLPDGERSLDNLLNSFYLFYAKQHGINKERWGDKTPLNVFYLKKISKVFPNAKYIHIIRNPYDSIYSYINSKLYDNYKDATLRWVSAVKLSKKFGENRNEYLEIFYEDLVSKPETEIKKVCSFLNIAFEENMFSENKEFLGDINLRSHHSNVLKPINTSSIGKGLKKLSSQEKDIIDNILKHNNSKWLMGYLQYYNIK